MTVGDYVEDNTMECYEGFSMPDELSDFSQLKYTSDGAYAPDRPKHFYNAVELCAAKDIDELIAWERLKVLGTVRRLELQSHGFTKYERICHEIYGYRSIRKVQQKVMKRLWDMQDLFRFFDPNVKDVKIYPQAVSETYTTPITDEQAYSLLQPDSWDTDFILIVEKYHDGFRTRGIFDTRKLKSEKSSRGAAPSGAVSGEFVSSGVGSSKISDRDLGFNKTRNTGSSVTLCK